ncbi:hypothetical protein DBR47_17445 [Paucibacter sp. KBW04]|uniref:hypothetical protein n=1 Tax=Paucibacter sp. KBW04 TaxID=2153361 RepID=UPI000F587036|nr:hypothetical protein [Paucibacter sp. KBW04]RQO56318.1 hypothetical protein DBR47_17445 [Paucibacter sp. KBW04]
MFIFELVLSLIGLGLLIYGYRKNCRNLLLAAALTLVLAGGAGDFVQGLKEGSAASVTQG